MMSVKVRNPLMEHAVEGVADAAHMAAVPIKYVILLAGFGHFAVAVPDVYKAVDDIKAAGGLPYGWLSQTVIVVY